MQSQQASRNSLDEFLAQYYARNPVNATFTGVHTHDALLPDWSPEGRAQDAAELRTLRDILAAQTPSLDTMLAQANIDVRLAEYESGFMQERNPALWTGEAIFGAVSLMTRRFATPEERLASLVARLNAVPRFLESLPHALLHAPPQRWTGRALRECRAAQRLFGSGLDGWLALLDEKDDNLTGARAAGERARAAFQTCEQWLETLPAAEEGAYAAGPELFDVLLQRGHFCTRSVNDLLAEAEEALRTAQATLSTMAGDARGSWPRVQQQLAELHPTAETYYESFAQTWDACYALTRKHELVTWPESEWPISYYPISRWARDAAPELYWLSYRSPAPFDPYTRHDYRVTPIEPELGTEECNRRLRAWNHSVIKLNHVVHHGALGHHVQNWHATHRSRTRIGTIAAVDCASRIGMFLGGSMAEGWACYASELMEEFGFLTPLESVAQQHSRVRMLVRAIVDIKLHTQGLSSAEAVSFYQTAAELTKDASEAEVTKNTMFPCTALMYWLGTQGILDLRAELQRRQGSAFRLRAFHDELLSYGSIPVPLVASLMVRSF